MKNKVFIKSVRFFNIDCDARTDLYVCVCV